MIHFKYNSLSVEMDAVKAKLVLVLLILCQNTFVSAQWQPLNGPFEGGQINKINSKDSTIFACTESGLYKSIYGSSLWTRLSNGLPYKPFLDIEFLGSYIFVATSGNKIYRSNDNGQTWNNYSLGITDSIVQTIKSIDTILFAGTYSQGLFVSYNYGINWTQVTGVVGGYVSKIESYGNILFVSVAGFGVYVSYDKGNSWSLPSTTLDTYAFRSMAVDSSRVLVTSNGDNVFISLDTCKTWINLNVTNYSRAVIIHGVDIYIAPYGGPIKKSSDNGVSWTNISVANLSSTAIHDLYYHDSTLYVGTHLAGIYASNDDGLSWSEDNVGIKGWISSVSAVGNNIFAGTVGNGLYRSIDFGNTWIKSDSGLNDQYISSIANLYGYIYAATSTGVFISTNLGVSWTALQGISGGRSVIEVVGSRIYTGRTIYPNVHYSDDGGLTWLPTNVSTPNGCKSISGFQNYVIAGSYFQPYASFSNDFGLNWLSVSATVSSSIAASTFTSNYVFAGGSTIWRSNLSNNSWSQSAAGWPPNTWVQCMYTQGGTNLIAGGLKGIFISSNQGVFWSDFNDGLEYKNIIDIYENSGLLYLATSNGIWTRPVITNLEVESQLYSDQSLSVFPNPSHTTIEVHWNTNSVFKKLYLLNEMGQNIYECEITSLNRITIRTDGFARGIYFIKIVGDSNLLIDKLILQ